MPGMRLIAGSGRSGTTWVLDALASANGLRPVFEPLNPYASSMGNQYAHRALAADEAHPELQEYFEDVCAGKRERLWTQYRRHRHWLFPPPAALRSMAAAARLWRRWGKFLKEAPGLATMSTRPDPLVKCIWANLMLGWLSRQFSCPIVLVVRHPGAVIESELRSEWDPRFALDRFKSDSRLHELTSDRYRHLLERQLTPIEGLAARWLIENQWAIEMAPTIGVTIVFYERLKASPESEWERVRKAFDLQWTPDAAIRARPSQQSSPKGSESEARVSGRALWQRVLTQDQLSAIQGVLDQAQFEVYSMSNAVPREGTNRAALTGAIGGVR